MTWHEHHPHGTWRSLWDDLRLIVAGRLMDAAMAVAPRNPDGLVVVKYVGKYSEEMAHHLSARVRAIQESRRAC